MAYNAVQIMAHNYPVLVDGRACYFVQHDGKRLELTTDASKATGYSNMGQADAVAYQVGDQLKAAVFPFTERPAPDTQSDRETWRLLIDLAGFLAANGGDGRHLDAFLDGLKPAEWAVAKATVTDRAAKRAARGQNAD